MTTRSLTSHWAVDPSIRFRWEARINEDGGVLWLRSNDLPVSSFITESELYDTALSQDGEEVWLCLQESRYSANQSALPFHYYQGQSGVFSLQASTGNDYSYDAMASALDLDDASSPHAMAFYSNNVDPQDHLLAAGYYQERARFSATSYAPLVELTAKTDAQQAVLMSWDKYGNLLYFMQTQYGWSTLQQTYSDEYGNLYLLGMSEGGAFVDDTLVPSTRSSFLMKLSACQDDCSRHGVCIFGERGAPGHCECHAGWEGELCDQGMGHEGG